MTKTKSFFIVLLLLSVTMFTSSAQETVSPVSIVHHLGVTSFTIEPTGENQRTIQLKGKPVVVNERLLDLNESRFEISKNENLLNLVQIKESGETQSLQYDGDKFILTKGEVENEVTDDLIENLSTEELNVFIVLANVLKEADVHFDDGEVVVEPSKAWIGERWCDHVVITAGMGRSGSASKCSKQSAAFLRAHKDCYKIGDCDTSCVYADHLCFSTALFGCTGPSCNNLIGIN